MLLRYWDFFNAIYAFADKVLHKYLKVERNETVDDAVSKWGDVEALIRGLLKAFYNAE